MADGWIKLHRAIEDNPRFRDAKWLQVWIKCLILATHKAYRAVFDGKVIELQPGQFITSRKTLARETDTHESRVERILKTLEIEQQIEQVGGATSRLITVTKWADYQSSEQDDEQRANSQRTASEQRANTNKNVKKKNKDLEAPAILEPDNIEATRDTLRAAVACDLLENPEFAEAWNGFLEMRRSIRKPAGDRAQRIILKALKGYPIETAIRMVDKSTANSWQGVFPLKEESHGTHRKTAPGFESAQQRRDRRLREVLARRRDPAEGDGGFDHPALHLGAEGTAG